MPAIAPPMVPLIEPFLGKPYGEHECWRLVCELLHAGGFVDVPDDPIQAIEAVSEVWFRDDPRDPLTLVQPWDWWLMPREGPLVGHIGLVVDAVKFIHVRLKGGVCLEPMQRWRTRLIQLARLRCLF
jgi:hypothetical protein